MIYAKNSIAKPAQTNEDAQTINQRALRYARWCLAHTRGGKTPCFSIQEFQLYACTIWDSLYTYKQARDGFYRLRTSGAPFRHAGRGAYEWILFPTNGPIGDRK